jgi:hypothetical protein
LYLHLQGRKICELIVSTDCSVCSYLLTLVFLASRFFYPEDGSDTILRNVGSHRKYTAP